MYQGYMGMSCVFGSGAESRVGARDVISYDNGSSITCSYLWCYEQNRQIIPDEKTGKKPQIRNPGQAEC